MRDMPGQLIASGHQSNGHAGGASITDCAMNSDSRELTLPMGLGLTRHIVGVVLTDERCQNNDHCHPLGVLLLDSLDITAEDLRRILYKQICSLPSTFTILTKQGWPLSENQECKAHISSIIKENSTLVIQRHYDRPRIGIISTTGEVIGFIFVHLKCNVSQMREDINEQLPDLKKREYRFLESNGWPVTTQQESALSVFDVFRPGYRVFIEYCDKHVAYTEPIEVVKCPRELPIATPSGNPPAKGGLCKGKSKKPVKAKWASLIKKENNLVAKPILISYVRAEAVKHALDLKSELERLGHSVYLDVHEIKTGSDWQDALNFAVSNCKVFVPLITPMYGKTQWTNREVKLADVLQKSIIPISFLEQWPPACLAIQFASTQYIYWKPADPDHGKAELEPKSSDPRVWENMYIKRVCKALEERCKNDEKRPLDNEEVCYRSAPFEKRNFHARKYTKRKFVVISAHPKQKVLVHQLKVTLESDGYDVWCSWDLQDCQESGTIDDYFNSSNANTPRDLTAIPEKFSVFGQTYNEIASAIADSKRAASQKTEIEAHFERKQLSRMISQVSDISQVSSLTPDKMERLKMFQQKADLAGVVIIIVSEAYTQSKTSQQQVFYCEHRKHVVLVKFDQHLPPSWFTMLVGNDMITNVNSPQFITTLTAQVKRALNPSSSETPKDATSEAKIQYLVNYMKKNIPQPETCVYIAGSSKLQSARSEAIARAIGKELAKVRNITLCTGGFFGAPDIVSHAFYESIQNNQDVVDELREPVVHLLPFKDSKDFSSKTNQNPDGSFEAVSFGKTYFAGDSVKDRETAVARLFDTCIVIEGGPGAAHEVEEFIWNDHFVIPIISTGGAAGGQYGVPLKIFEIPPCVSESDWCFLSDKEATPENIAQAVVNIVITLKQSIVTHIASQEEETKSKNRMRPRSRKYKTAKEQEANKARQTLKKDEMVQTQSEVSAHGHRLLKRQTASHVTISNYKYGTRWQRFIRIFSAKQKR